MTIEKNSRPESEVELDRILKKAYSYACKSDCQKALEICEWLIQEASTEMAGHRKRTAIREHMGDLDGAVSDLQYVVSNSPVEPADFYGLALLQFQQGLTTQAVASLTKVIELGNSAGFAYYTQGSLLFRAEAYLKLCDFESAVRDCLALPTGYKTYMGSNGGMRSREDVLDEASAAIRSKKR